MGKRDFFYATTSDVFNEWFRPLLTDVGLILIENPCPNIPNVTAVLYSRSSTHKYWKTREPHLIRI